MDTEMFDEDEKILFDDPLTPYMYSLDEISNLDLDSNYEDDELYYYNILSKDEKIIIEQYINNTQNVQHNIDYVFPEETSDDDYELTPEILNSYLVDDSDFRHFYEKMMNIKVYL